MRFHLKLVTSLAVFSAFVLCANGSAQIQNPIQAAKAAYNKS
jgi:hypothetical protein